MFNIGSYQMVEMWFAVIWSGIDLVSETYKTSRK